MSDKRDYFKELAKKAFEEVPVELDERILAKVKGKKSVGWFRPVAITLSCFFILLVGIRQFRINDSDSIPIEVVQDVDFYEHMELLGEIDEIDLVDLSDEEWEVLLEGDKDV